MANKWNENFTVMGEGNVGGNCDVNVFRKYLRSMSDITCLQNLKTKRLLLFKI